MRLTRNPLVIAVLAALVALLGAFVAWRWIDTGHDY